jgi:hypothetical protein
MFIKRRFMKSRYRQFNVCYSRYYGKHKEDRPMIREFGMYRRQLKINPSYKLRGKYRRIRDDNTILRLGQKPY